MIRSRLPALAPLPAAGGWREWRATLGLLPGLLAHAARLYPAGAPGWAGRRARFVASALRHPVAHRALAAFLARPPFDALGRRHPQLLQKVHKPFPHRGTDVATRVTLVARHYALARARLGAELHEAVSCGRELVFARLPLPAGRGTLEARLSKQPRFEREGELALALHDPFGSLLYTACVTLVDGPRAGECGVLVGALNGTAPVDVLRHLTRLMHGLRPTGLMLFLLQQLARRAGASSLRAVGRETHAYWGHPRHAEIRFDYDRCWEEAGGTREADGLWTLPLVPRRRPPAELPARHRAAHARRYAWLDAMAAEVDAAADVASAGPAPAEGR